MPTLPQHEEPNQAASDKLVRRVTVLLTDEASRRLRVAATLREVPMGRILSEILIENLPSVDAGRAA